MRHFFSRPGLAPGIHYLVLSGIGAALVYSALLLRFPLLKIYMTPIVNLNHMTPSEWPTGLFMIVCVTLLFGSYCLGALGIRAARPRRLTPLLIAGFPLIFVAPLLLTQPMTSTDVYDYLFRGRMLAHYGANTFVSIPRDFAYDPLFRYVAWQQAVTAYGPLWEGMSWLTARLAGEAPGSSTGTVASALLPLILAYRTMALLGFLLCGTTIWAALGRIAPERRWLGLYLWLWNPLALWESVAAVHNDAWMALLIVLAVWAISPGQGDKETRRQGDTVTRWQGDTEINDPESPEHPVARSPGHPVTRSIAAFLALTAGGLIKFVAFFFGPVLLVAELRRLPGWRARLRLVLLGGLACAALVALAYAPFWAGWDTLRNFGDRRALYTASWLAALHALLVPVLSEDYAHTIAAASGMALLTAGVCWASWRAWRAPRDTAAHLLWLVLWFLFLCNPWFQPWYAIWALALVVLQPWRARVLWGVGLFCYTALLSYVVGGLFLPALGLNERSGTRELLISVLIYVPPLIALAWGRRLRPLGLWRSFQRLRSRDRGDREVTREGAVGATPERGGRV